MTIRDVAADAGVAPSTVSYVLSGNKRLPDATVQKVLTSVSRLGYRPSPTGRALALGRTNIIGMLASFSQTTTEDETDVFMRFVRAAMYSAQPRGYDILVMGRGDDELAGDPLVDALMVMDIRVEDPRLPILRDMGRPTVLIGVPDDPMGFSAVDLDFDAAARLMVRHLCGLGHRGIAVLADPVKQADREHAFRQRFRTGFAEECRAQGAQGVFLPTASGRPDVEQWLDAVQAELPDVSAILVIAVGALDSLQDALAERGRRVPRDVSMIVLTPAEASAARRAGLSLVDLPGRAMVERAVALVLDQMAGGPAGSVELLPAVMEEHGSTAAPGRGLFGARPRRRTAG